MAFYGEERKSKKAKRSKKKSTEFATDCNLVLSETNKMSRLRRGVTKKKKKRTRGRTR